jgi:hypothetical protein
MKTNLVARNVAVLGVLGLAACLGNIGDGGPGSGPPGSIAGGSGSGSNMPGSSSGTNTTQSQPCKNGASFASARVSLISDDQYQNIVHDVFGVTIPATYNHGGVVSTPSTTGAYPLNEGAQIAETTVLQNYLSAADEVASLMTAMPPCTAGTVNATCIETFLRNKLPLAWRRPVTDAEIAGLVNIFNLGAPDGPTRQIKIMMEAALIHPAFLYRTEIGTGAATATGKVPLTPFELASAVSFAVLNTVPDAELWAKAQDGSLTTSSVLASEVARLMALPAAQAFLTKKVSYYLNFEAVPYVQKDPKVFPEFAALQPVLYQSSQMFVNDIVWNGTFNDLFTSRKVYANQAMAMTYGLPAVTGTQLQAVTTTGDAYNAGVLTQPALLLSTNPKPTAVDDVVHRGLWVFYNLLCAPGGKVPDPPADAATKAAMMMGSTRQIAEQRDTGCGAACHGRFDTFGIVTLNYDGIGRYRTADPTSTPPGGPIDTSATISSSVVSSAKDGMTVKGAADVAQLFTSGSQVSDCAADSLAKYTLDHDPVTENSCDLQGVKGTFQKSGKFSDLFTAILASPAFLTRDL